MHVKEITRPDVRETFFYGKIISFIDDISL